MTVQELYNWARLHGALHIEIEVDYAENAPNYPVSESDIRIENGEYPIPPKFVIYLP